MGSIFFFQNYFIHKYIKILYIYTHLFKKKHYVLDSHGQQKGKDYCSIQRILEGSENISNWKSLIRIIKSPTPFLHDWIKLNHMTKSNIQMFSELWQVWCCDHFPRSLLQWLTTLSVKKYLFPNVQPELPWHILIPFPCVLSYCWTRSLVLVIVRILTFWYLYWKKERQAVVSWLETLKN